MKYNKIHSHSPLFQQFKNVVNKFFFNDDDIEILHLCFLHCGVSCLNLLKISQIRVNLSPVI